MGVDAATVLAYGSLLGGYRTSAALEPLVRTGRLTGDETLRRIGETTAWWRGVTAPGGLEPGADGWRLALHVRVMHAFVNDHLEKDPTWPWERLGVPINQYDQASTLGVFSTSFLLHARLLGVRVSRADSAAIMHLWSYVGWLMGVDPAWLPRTERVGRRLLYHFLSYDPAPDENSQALATALLDMFGSAPMPAWRRRLEREKALSAGTWLLGRAAMRDLGVPGGCRGTARGGSRRTCGGRTSSAGFPVAGAAHRPVGAVVRRRDGAALRLRLPDVGPVAPA